MAMLKIWGRQSSSNVQKVLWCCDELGIPFERVDLGGRFGGNDDPKYRALNPNGLVPTINDNGFILWESNAITRYLARKYGKGALLPQDPAAAATAERWMDWQLSHLNPAMVPIFFGYIRTPPEKRDMAAIEAARKRAIELWRMVEAQLAGNLYLNGKELSLGDFGVGIWAYRWFTMPIERPDLPNFAAWYKRLSARKPYQSDVMIPLE